MPGSNEEDKQSKVPLPSDPIANVLVDLTHKMVSLFTCLEALESRAI